jgi:hypothetical protein
MLELELSLFEAGYSNLLKKRSIKDDFPTPEGPATIILKQIFFWLAA